MFDAGRPQWPTVIGKVDPEYTEEARQQKFS
jgi:hypothetical protein